MAGLVTSTKNTIVEYLVVGMPSEDDSQGQEDVRKSIAGEERLDAPARVPALIALLLAHVDRVPSAPIKALISSLAERKNYGLEDGDLPKGLPDGVKELPDVSGFPSTG